MGCLEGALGVYMAYVYMYITGAHRCTYVAMKEYKGCIQGVAIPYNTSLRRTGRLAVHRPCHIITNIGLYILSSSFLTGRLAVHRPCHPSPITLRLHKPRIVIIRKRKDLSPRPRAGPFAATAPVITTETFLPRTVAIRVFRIA
jgi:hypothetical protein